MKAETIGIEVELAIFHLRRPVVCSFLPFTKEYPRIGEDGTLYHKDASMFEIAMPPCANGEELDAAYMEAIDEVCTMLPDGMEWDLVPAVTYSDSELASDPYASKLGCGASRNLYKGYVNMPAEYPDNTRYAGMHVNIQADNSMSPLNIFALDATLGLKSVRDWEPEYSDAIRTRRTMYGRAGEYRRKPFGMEYRTLPASAWSKTNGDELFHLVNTALSLNIDKVRPLRDRIMTAIDTCNQGEADELLHEIHEGAI